MARLHWHYSSLAFRNRANPGADGGSILLYNHASRHVCLHYKKGIQNAFTVDGGFYTVGGCGIFQVQ